MAANNPSRDVILQRIRDGLRTPALAFTEKTFASPIFQPVQDPLARFQQECKANLMECQLTANAQESAKLLAQVLESLPGGQIFIQDDPVLRHLAESSRTSRPVRWSSEGGPSGGGPLESSQATVTLAEALIAQTGSILVTASCGGRGASVVAPCHIVYANTAQLVPDLVTVLRDAAKRTLLDTNSFACIISGSSRTADIEKILVQGAHGPMRLVVILEISQ